MMWEQLSSFYLEFLGIIISRKLVSVRTL